LDGIELFDPAAFAISDAEAMLMDPQQRLLLETTPEAVAMSKKLLYNTTAGVFIGIATTEYTRLAEAHTKSYTPYSASSHATISVAPGRLSYIFGFKGPSIAVDTACSSSLVTLHMATTGVLLGHCTSALNAGTNMLVTPHACAMLVKAGMLASDGRCKALSDAADGYARAEICTAVVLHSLDGASSEEGLLVVVKGTAVNQDGRSSTLTAPNGPAQQEVVRAAVVAGQVDPSCVSSLHMHGTGTSLGDPIEVGAAAAVLMESRKTEAVPQHLALMASKSWTGHAEAGAGIIGLLHVQASLSQAAALPILHLRGINPYVLGELFYFYFY
jgi:acyl transferase domain-containing protein